MVSFWFDGHTVSKGFRPLHALINSVHLLAGSIWVGGVVMMAIVVWRRSRAGRPTGAAELALRFSPLATLSLVAVAAAGLSPQKRSCSCSWWSSPLHWSQQPPETATADDQVKMIWPPAAIS